MTECRFNKIRAEVVIMNNNGLSMLNDVVSERKGRIIKDPYVDGIPFNGTR